MSKEKTPKAPATPATENSAAVSTQKASSTVSHVKAIKNSLFKDLKIGESVKVAGIIRGVQSKEGQYGSYEEFKGDFACQHNGIVYRGTKLFLPAVAADVLKNQYLDVLENSGTADSTKLKIEFKIVLTKSPDDSPKNAQKFQWVFENLQETAPESDKVLALMG